MPEIHTESLQVGDFIELTGEVTSIRYAPAHRMYEVTVEVNDTPVVLWTHGEDLHEVVR